MAHSIHHLPKPDQIARCLGELPIQAEGDFELIASAFEALLNKQPLPSLPRRLKERIEPLHTFIDTCDEGSEKDAMQKKIAEKVDQFKGMPSEAKAAYIHAQQRLPLIETPNSLYRHNFDLLKADLIAAFEQVPQSASNCAYPSHILDEVDDSDPLTPQRQMPEDVYTELKALFDEFIEAYKRETGVVLVNPSEMSPHKPK